MLTQLTRLSTEADGRYAKLEEMPLKLFPVFRPTSECLRKD